MTPGSNQSALTDLNFWSTRNKRIRKDAITPSKPVWFDRIKESFVGENAPGSALEIGVYPGKMLLFLAENTGMECHGIDFDDQINNLISHERFEENNVSLVHDDLFTWNPGRTFDFVYSHGFIEHFTSPRKVVEKHWELVSPGGLLLLSVPAHTLAQYWMRRTMYKREYWEEARRTHNARVMKLKPLVRLTSKLNGSTLVSAYHCGEFRATFGFGKKALRPWAKFVIPLLRPLELTTRRLKWSSGLFSPTACVIVKKEH